eukprot:g31640.t1
MPAISSSVMAMISAPPLRWLFWKKTGEELEKGLEKVQAVYGQDGPKFLHFTCHPIKRRSRKAVLLLALGLWLWLYPVDLKFRCLLLSLAYSFVECGFTFFERGKAYTSLAQFLGNLVYMPVLLDWYGHFLGDSPRLYVFLFPVNIWLLEIAQGLAIQWIFGQNVAWCYADYADELLTFIRLGHAIWWWGLGLVLWFLYPAIFMFSLRSWRLSEARFPLSSFPTRKAASVFDFGDPCAAIDLDAGYYVTGPVLAVNRLPKMVGCQSLRESGRTSGPYNIARIFVQGPLKGELIYGFSISVRNPTLQEVAQILSVNDPWSSVDWNLTTRGPATSAC